MATAVDQNAADFYDTFWQQGKVNVISVQKIELDM